MRVFLNGNFVPEAQAVVSVFDRAFLYGDGLFETILVANAVPFRWAQHFDRLQRGAAFLQIPLPYTGSQLREFALQLILENYMTSGLLRLSLSRGVGIRGYSPRGPACPTVVMSLHAAPNLNCKDHPGWKLATSSIRLPAQDPLAQWKHCNKLPQILSRAQAEQNEADEALLVNTDGFVVEGATSNLFWIANETVCNPQLLSGALPGVTRLVVLELCEQLGLKTKQYNVTNGELTKADGIFLSLSSMGIVPAISLDGKPLLQSSLIKTLSERYLQTVENETAKA
jgi:aminodeoxychorismate lyase